MWGALLFTLGFGVLFYRIYIAGDYPFLGIYNGQTIWLSFILELAPALVFIYFAVRTDNFRKKFRSLTKLLLPYMFFGGLQQILYLCIFADMSYYLTGSVIYAFILSFFYFFVMHINWRPNVRKFWPLLGLFGLINVWIYLIWGNLLPQVLVHGIVGTFLFTIYTETDQLKLRLG